MNAAPRRTSRSHEDWEVIDDSDLVSVTSQSPMGKKTGTVAPINVPMSISPPMSLHTRPLPTMQLSPEVMRELAPAVLEILNGLSTTEEEETCSAPASPLTYEQNPQAHIAVVEEALRRCESPTDVVTLQARVEELMLELQRSQMRVDRFVAASERSDGAFQFAWALGLVMALLYKRMCFSSTVGVVGAVVFGCVLAWHKEAARLRDALKAEMDDATVRILFQKEDKQV